MNCSVFAISMHSLGKENKVLAKENLKLNSINESLKQLSDSSSVADINQESAVDEYNRLKKKVWIGPD